MEIRDWHKQQFRVECVLECVPFVACRTRDPQIRQDVGNIYKAAVGRFGATAEVEFNFGTKETPEYGNRVVLGSGKKRKTNDEDFLDDLWGLSAPAGSGDPTPSRSKKKVKST